MDKLAIILAAGTGKRTKSYGPKSLMILNNGESILERQIRILQKEKYDIGIVLGFEGLKIEKSLYADIYRVHNHFYESTNTAGSLYSGLAFISKNYKEYLIIHGDLVFSEDYLNSKELPTFYTTKHFKSSEIGVSESYDSSFRKFTYTSKNKWSQIANLKLDEAILCRKIIHNNLNKHGKFFDFEIYNMMTQEGFKPNFELNEKKIFDIDSHKELLQCEI